MAKARWLWPPPFEKGGIEGGIKGIYTLNFLVRLLPRGGLGWPPASKPFPLALSPFCSL